jgi:peptide/nickel transport system substrate-binding protein
MDDLVFEQRRAAYSDTAAGRFSVPWISLVLERDAGLVDRTLRQLERDEFVPPAVADFGGQPLVSPDEAVARYEAARDWFDDKEHLVISQGPFYLEQFDPPAQFAELIAFRDPSYPFKPGDFFQGDPPTLSVDPAVPEPVIPGDDAVVEVAVSGPGDVQLQYLLVDQATGAVVDGGPAESSGDGAFSVVVPGDVTFELFPGLYDLFVAASSDSLARIAEREVVLEVLP